MCTGNTGTLHASSEGRSVSALADGSAPDDPQYLNLLTSWPGPPPFAAVYRLPLVTLTYTYDTSQPRRCSS